MPDLMQSPPASVHRKSKQLSLVDRARTGLRIIRIRVKEFLLYDSRVFKFILGTIGWFVGNGLYHCGKRRQGFCVLAKLHRSDYSDWVSRSVSRMVGRAATANRNGTPHPLQSVLNRHGEAVVRTRVNAKFYDSPESMLESNILVLKSPSQNEKGVILLYYSYVYPLFFHSFDVREIARRYHLVLEPSWCGLCDLDILAFMRLDSQVFVGTLEPRDREFIESLRSNLIPLHFANNTWVDHRVFRPLPGIAKDIDIVMVANWSPYKRHWAFLAALAKLRHRGLSPSVALIGYPFQQSRDDVHRMAQYYGVDDLLEYHEYLAPVEVNRFLNRAKVNVLWSRKEGSNRILVEGMFAGTAGVIRDGHNYGFRYQHVNAKTGRFSSEADLPDVLTELIRNHESAAPREWVLEHMSCQRSTAILNEGIRAKAFEMGESWTMDLVVKTNELNDLKYWNLEDAARFRDDYAFLRSMRLG